MMCSMLKKLLLFSFLFFSFYANAGRFFPGVSENFLNKSVYGIYAFAPSLAIVANDYYHLKRPEQYFKKNEAVLVEKDVADFVKKEAAAAGLPTAQEVITYKMPAANLDITAAAAFGDNTIMLSDRLVRQIRKGTRLKADCLSDPADLPASWVNTKLELAEYLLNDARGTIHHEAAHLKNKDSHTGLAASLISPFVVHGTIKVFKGILQKPVSKVSCVRSAGAGMAVNIAGQALATGFFRYQEKRADQNIAQDSDILRVKALTYRMYAADYKRLSMGTKLKAVVLPIVNPLALKKFPMLEHPSFLYRAKAFEARAKKLEASTAAEKK